MPVEVVADVPVLVAALSGIGPGAVAFPATPPRSGQPEVDALGVFAYPDKNFALNMSDEIVEGVVVTLRDTHGLAWSAGQVDRAIEVLSGLAAATSGGLITPEFSMQIPTTVGLSAIQGIRAAASHELGNPRVVVTSDPAALRLDPFAPRGIPHPPDQPIAILSPAAFTAAAERARWKLRPA